jgi:hypothetical protein
MDCFKIWQVLLLEYLECNSYQTQLSGVVGFSLVFYFHPKTSFCDLVIVMRDALATRRKLLNWGYKSEVKCVFCQYGIEDRDHFLFFFVGSVV